MDENQELSELIGSIYDASLDLDLWDGVLQRTSGFLQSATATIGSFDRIYQATNFSKAWGYDPVYLDLLLNRYIKTNPMNFSAALTKAGDVHAIGDLLPYEEFYASAMYREWGEPQGYIDAIQATLEKTPTSLAFLHCIRHRSVGMVDNEIRRRITLLAPHFRRAVLIGKVLELNRIQVANFTETLDGLAAAMVMVDGRARIVHANRPARAMMREGDIVKDIYGRFAVTDPKANKALEEMFTLARDGDAAVGTRGITVALNLPEQEGHLVHVLPLTSGTRRQAGAAFSAVAAVFIRKAGIESPLPAETLVEMYGFTPAELRVLLALVEIGGVPDVASVLGLSQATVKTHLRRLFEKTRTHRQSELVKLVTGLVGPVS